jgi:hypothetical protein
MNVEPRTSTPESDRERADMLAAEGPQRPVRPFLVQLGHRGRAGAADYFYQIVILVIGVFLGITFEGIAADWDRAGKAYAAVVQLLGDVKRDSADMTRIIAAQQARVRDFSEIAQWLANPRDLVSARIDSLLESVTTSPTVYPRRGLYTSMMSAGQIALLSDRLSADIVNLYENVYTRLAANGEHHDYSLERDFFPAYARAWDPSRRALITPDPTERVRFRNHVLLMRAWSDYYSKLVAENQVELRSVMAGIQTSRHGGR